jgi:hypothetical protein
MTNPRPDHDMALPHVGLLAYFRRPASAPPQLDVEASPPPYDRNTLHQAVFLDDATPKSNDEEATFGFWGEREHGKARPHVSHPSMLKRGYHGASAFFCFWFAVSVCILGAFGAFFVVDLVFTRLGMGTGMATWMVHRNVGRGVASYEVSRVTRPSLRRISLTYARCSSVSRHRIARHRVHRHGVTWKARASQTA